MSCHECAPVSLVVGRGASCRLVAGLIHGFLGCDRYNRHAAGSGQSDVVDEDGQASPVIGWNDLHVLYQLPDGSKWAEHGSLYDSEDLVSQCIYNLMIIGLVYKLVYITNPRVCQQTSCSG